MDEKIKAIFSLLNEITLDETVEYLSNLPENVLFNYENQVSNMIDLALERKREKHERMEQMR